MIPRLELLLTEHCTLCEQALDVLLGHRELAGVRLQTVDVAGDDNLLEAYGEHIPVLRCGDATLFWPFDAAAVSRWLNALDTS